MERKRIVWISVLICSFAGSMVPSLWGEGSFSMSSVLLSAVGGIAGIYIGFKIAEHF